MKRLALTEDQIEKQVLTWLKMKQIFAFKVRSVGTYDPKIRGFRAPSPWFRKGCPDVLVCFKGRFIGLEIKTPKGTLSESQESFHKDLADAGGFAYVVRDVEELKGVFETLEVLFN